MGGRLSSITRRLVGQQQAWNRHRFYAYMAEASGDDYWWQEIIDYY